jgi:DNA processing protein
VTLLLKKADAEIKKAEKQKAEIVTFFDENYPAELREIYDPPILLYAKGALPPQGSAKVAVVGSRASSLYGQRTARNIARDLASAGVVVVSGMALGIDTAAHEGALSADGITVAVLGGGLSRIYPKENKKIAEQIAEKGAVISEYPMEMEPRPAYFPIRNRIISGLSQAVLVVEAKEKSGALITADAALEQGRDVFAVPGNVDSERSGGTNNLLKQGAKLASSAEDILEELRSKAESVLSVRPSLKKVPAETKDLGENEKRILSLLDSETLQADVLIEQSGLSAGETMTALTFLQMKGLVKEWPGKNFSK